MPPPKQTVDNIYPDTGCVEKEIKAVKPCGLHCFLSYCGAKITTIIGIAMIVSCFSFRFGYLAHFYLDIWRKSIRVQ